MTSFIISPTLLLVIVLAYLPVAFSLWHTFTHAFPTRQEKLLWACLVIFIPVFGAIAYLLFGLKRNTGKTGLGFH